ncbi:hypothetical protein H2203_006432 [Taxawa tesnikishii (nom. ined.)]|nr:hypothetical protein H2203_006432 [Dothideales sp. JES 119]
MRTTFLCLTCFCGLAAVLIYLTSAKFPTFPSHHRSVHSLWSGDDAKATPEPVHVPVPSVKDDEARGSTHAEWQFDYARDARNYGLSHEQCSSAFPLLYKEIDRAVEHRRGNKIDVSEVDTAWRGDGIVRAMIYKNQLYIIENRGVWDGNHRPRSIATLHALHRAITAYSGPLPNIEFTITDHDSAYFGENTHQTTWAYARLPSSSNLWLMPDFGYWGWPDVGLRSVDVAARDVRAKLLQHSSDKGWSDVRALDWRNETDIKAHLLGMEEHCAYMFVAQTEGNTYSGRLKFLLNCRSVLVSHRLEWVEHFHHLLRPDGPERNYALVKRDFSDLDATISSLLSPKGLREAERIAENARKVFRERYLTPAAEACYWRKLIQGWSEVQGFETEFWKEVEVERLGRKKAVRKPRGVPFEAYVIMEAVGWEIPTKPRKICEYE